ncbi:hypothetical protein FIBSPDRAFT_184159 [Athelia psychrophila]|uniref:Uncharacterized protein n=1 Tax=Athelia psychrophila TaxID=1759441 RepID=A0A166AF80_9AGAM|nr:hypothetical protein FIBSPDRAFT_184159 [Fibularhizoctonia sp. CBS 109695]
MKTPPPRRLHAITPTRGKIVRIMPVVVFCPLSAAYTLLIMFCLLAGSGRPSTTRAAGRAPHPASVPYRRAPRQGSSHDPCEHPRAIPISSRRSLESSSSASWTFSKEGRFGIRSCCGLRLGRKLDWIEAELNGGSAGSEGRMRGGCCAGWDILWRGTGSCTWIVRASATWRSPSAIIKDSEIFSQDVVSAQRDAVQEVGPVGAHS